jgi:uncharacterized protein (TIGR00725 family)
MIYIGVIGESTTDQSTAGLAYEVGKLIAQAGALLVCGGLSGVMTEAARGAKSAGGQTVGILPGDKRDEANQYIDIAIPTGMGEARNVIVVKSSDALIAIGGYYGTLSEIAFALKLGKPIVYLGPQPRWNPGKEGLPGDTIHRAGTAIEAVERILPAVRNRGPEGSRR